MKKILVTRPQPVAAALAERLQEEGYEVFIEPLLHLSPLCLPPPDVPQDAAIIMTSRLVFSVLASQRWQIAPRLSRPCYCIGSRTAAEARAFGFTDVRQGDGEGEHLARLILRDEPESLPLFHIGGEDISPEVLERLQAAGRSVVHWTVYKADASVELSQGAKEALVKESLDAALFFSPRTARVFVDLVETERLGSCCQSLTAIGLSKAVLQPLQSLPWRRLLASDKPTEAGVLDCLFRFLPVS